MLGWYRKIGLATKILIAMVIGIVLGFLLKGSYPVWSKVTVPIGTIFMRLLKMTIVPLVFFSIVGGISSMSDLKRMRKVGGRFIVYWATVSTLCAAIGIAWAYIIKPGIGVSLAKPDTAWSTSGVSVIDSLVNWIPDNPVNAMSSFNIIQVIVFALFVGIAISMLKPHLADGHRELLEKFFASGNTLMMRIVEIVIGFAPIGVLCLMANLAGSLGLVALGALGKMILTQYAAYITILVVVFPLYLSLIAKVNPLQHYKNIFPAMIVAFSTCSSGATLPVTMKTMKERSGVPSDTINLITPPAATINMQAVCAEMPIYAIFAAQLYGIHYTFGTLLVIVLLGVIMAAGVAGVPGGSIMMSAVMLQTMGLPLDIVPWIAGVFRVLDMPNTMINVTGDTVGMVTVSSVLGDLNRGVFGDEPGARDAHKIEMSGVAETADVSTT
jgi:Na+/H+-dicarboxylate symporter